MPSQVCRNQPPRCTDRHRLSLLADSTGSKRNEEQEEKKQKVNPSEQALHYLYILSMDGRKMKQNLEQDKAYLLDKMSKMTGDFSIYGKARAAVVLARNSQQNAAYRGKAANICRA